LIFELDTLLKEGGHDSNVAAKAAKLQDAILEHIDDEENSAFPHLQSQAHRAQAEMLTQSVREFRNALHFQPVPA